MARSGNVRISITADAKGVSRGVKDAQRDLNRLNGRSFTNLGNSASRASRSLSGSKGLNSSLRSTVATLGKIGLGVGIFTSLTSVIGDSIKEYEESIKVTKQTEAVLKSTGHAAHVTAGQIENLANALSNKTGIDDEAIQSAENLLLTFTNVQNGVGKGNDVFNQSTKTIVDMSVALKQDLKSATIQVGKALQDPIKGITALRRVGVNFTEDQKKQITTLVKSGKTMEAQKLILRELNKEFGGSAQKAATPLDKLKVAVKNLEESIGKALYPAVTTVARALTKFIGQLQSGKGAGGKFASAMKDVWKAVKDVWKYLQPTIQSVVKFVGKHPDILKVAGAIVAVGLALKTLSFASSITGVSKVLGLLGRLGRSRAGQAAVGAISKAFGGLAGRLRGALSTAASAIIDRLSSAGVSGGASSRDAINKRLRGVRLPNLAGKFGAWGALMGAAAGVAIAKAIADKLGLNGPDARYGPGSSGSGKVDDATGGPAPWWQSNVVDPLKDLLHLRVGGRAGYQAGGLVPAIVSPGEMLLYGTSAAMVPGAPVAADTVPMMLPTGTAVLTRDGQRRLSEGASLSRALATQAPHFREGGVATHRGRGSWFGGPHDPWDSGRTAFGFTTAHPGIALNEALHNSRLSALASARRAFYRVVAPNKRVAVLALTDKGPADWTHRGIDVTYSALGSLGYTEGNFPTDAIFRWEGPYQSRGDVRGGTGGGGSASAAGRRLVSPGRWVEPITHPRYQSSWRGLYSGMAAAIEGGHPITDAARRAISGLGLSGSQRRRWVKPVYAKVASGGSKNPSPPGGSSSLVTARRPIRETLAWAHAVASKFGLSIGSSYRTPAHNRAVGGVPNSWHTKGSPGRPEAFDFSPPNSRALGWIRKFTHPDEAMIHDAGSGLHLHVGGLYRKGGVVGRLLPGASTTGTLGVAPREMFPVTIANDALTTLWNAPDSKAGKAQAAGALTRLRGAVKGLGLQDLITLHTSAEGYRRLLYRGGIRGQREQVLLNRIGDGKGGGALGLISTALGASFGTAIKHSNDVQSYLDYVEGNLDETLKAQGIDPDSPQGRKAWADFRTNAMGALRGEQGKLSGLQRFASQHGFRDAARQIGKEIGPGEGSIRDSIRHYQASAFDAGRADSGDTSGGDDASNLLQMQNDLLAEIRDNQQRVLNVQSVTPQSLAQVLTEIVSGQIGGRIGLGFQSPSYAGGVARY